MQRPSVSLSVTHHTGLLLWAQRAGDINRLLHGWQSAVTVLYMIRYDTRFYFNVRSKADMCQLNLLHGKLNLPHVSLIYHTAANVGSATLSANVEN